MSNQLNAQDILEKQFKRSVKGYNIDEVDSYLNVIIEDYEHFEKQINELKEENQRLQQQLQESSRRPVVTPTVVPTPSPMQQTANTTNFDILKRLANLEKHVFGNKLEE